MQFKRTLITLLGLSTAALAQAQGNWPTKPVTLVVPFAAGGPTDVVARTLAASMTKSLGQTVVVENKLGAGGNVAASYVAKAAPDGYTFFIHHNGMATSTAPVPQALLRPLKDFEFVSQAVEVPMTHAGAQGLPGQQPAGDGQLHQGQPGKINLANAGLGAVSQLCGMMFQRAIGVQLTEVPFQGTAPAMNALLGGQVDVLCDQTTQTGAADQGRQRQALWRDDQEPREGAAGTPTLASRA
jgi:tripartite-type tricarboxylate transporter receptor subunit TctC